MSQINTAIQLTDMVTKPISDMISSVNLLCNSFNNVQDMAALGIDETSFKAAISASNEAAKSVLNYGDDINRAKGEQERFNEKVKQGSGFADGLGGKIKGFVAAFAGIAAMRGAVSWVKESIDLANVQTNVEQQLKAVLKNVKATEGAFESLKETAASIQGYSLYGDEAMIGGAAEFATYVSDPKAIETMMGTLADYAAGMSGGGEVGTQEMVNYATQLGKALEGSYDGLTKKGFVLTDAQKEIIDNGSDMERALVVKDVISQSWEGLAQQMADTPEGMKIQMKNAFGDIREAIAQGLYPALMNLYGAINDNMPQIEMVLNGFATGVEVIINAITGVIEVVGILGSFISDNWSIIEPMIVGIAAAFIAYNAVLAITALWEAIHGAAMMIATGATLSATAAQYGLNAALLSNPIFWVAIAIGVLIGYLYRWVKSVGGVKIAWLIAMNTIQTVWSSTCIAIQSGVYNVLNFFSKLKLGMQSMCIAIETITGNMKVSVLTTLEGLVNSGIDIINSFIEQLQKIPGVSLELIDKVTFGASASLLNEARKTASAAEYNNARDEMENIMKGRDNDIAKRRDTAKAEEMGRLMHISASRSDYENTQDSLLDSPLDALADSPLDMPSTMPTVPGNVSDIAKNTGSMKDSAEATTEELKYLRDVAEMEVINRFTTASITVEQNNNNSISGDRDIDGIVHTLTKGIGEAMEMVAEGSYA